MERATFAAGSFECIEETFRRIEGVQQTMVGYAGGWALDPSYFDVCTGTTGHAEGVEIYFDPGQVRCEQLPNVLRDAHDSTSFNRQGSDVGSQYRSAIFFHSLEQEAVARAPKKQRLQSGRFTRPIVTEIAPRISYIVTRGSAGSAQASVPLTPQRQVDVTEQELIRRVREGDKEAFYGLVRPCERALFFAARSVLNNDADAEEAAQEAVLKAFMHIEEFRGESKFSTWLVQIAINEARMKLRKEHRELYDSLDASAADEQGDYWPKDFADWREIPIESLQRKELREALSKALASLEPKYRQVLVWRDIQHFSIAETAEALSLSEEAVRTRLHRARLRMRDALAPGFDGAWIVDAGGRKYGHGRQVGLEQTS